MKINASNEQEQLNFKQVQLVGGVGSMTKKQPRAGRPKKGGAAATGLPGGLESS